MSEMQIGNNVSHNTSPRQPALVDAAALRMATRDAFLKLSPRHLVKSPVMAIVLLGTVLSAVITLVGQAAPGFGWTVTAILLLTVLFGNFAEAIAEAAAPSLAESAAIALVSQPEPRRALFRLLKASGLSVLAFGELPEGRAVDVIAVVGDALLNSEIPA